MGEHFDLVAQINLPPATSELETSLRRSATYHVAQLGSRGLDRAIKEALKRAGKLKPNADEQRRMKQLPKDLWVGMGGLVLYMVRTRLAEINRLQAERARVAALPLWFPEALELKEFRCDISWAELVVLRQRIMADLFGTERRDAVLGGLVSSGSAWALNYLVHDRLQGIDPDWPDGDPPDAVAKTWRALELVREALSKPNVGRRRQEPR
jgi:hypothetical protein